MVGIKKFKLLFFDKKAVINAVDKTTRKVLSKFGAFVRTAARSSIRTRKKASLPGQPPSSHTGLLKRFILFGYDTANKSVVVGPIKLNQKKGTAPSVLEFSGKTKIDFGINKGKTIHIAKRPYMNPALQKELPKLPAMWANSIK